MEKILCKICGKKYPKNQVSTWMKNSKTVKDASVCRKCNRDKQRLYRSTKNGKEAEKNASRIAYLKHKNKWLARAKVRYSILKGITIKPKKCEVCEQIKPLQAHHEDYEKPLEVIFLCYSCHADADRELSQSKPVV